MKKLILLLTTVFLLSSFSASSGTTELEINEVDEFATCHFTIVYRSADGGFYNVDYSVYALNQENCKTVYRTYVFLAANQ